MCYRAVEAQVSYSKLNCSLTKTFVSCQQVYKAWVNCCLAQIGDNTTVSDLAEDLKDGVVLCQLIKSTTGRDITQYQLVNEEVPWGDFHKNKDRGCSSFPLGVFSLKMSPVVAFAVPLKVKCDRR